MVPGQGSTVSMYQQAGARYPLTKDRLQFLGACLQAFVLLRPHLETLRVGHTHIQQSLSTQTRYFELTEGHDSPAKG